MNKLARAGSLAVLPTGLTHIYIVTGSGVPFFVRRFEDMGNIKAEGEHFLLCWPNSDDMYRYHCTKCFETKVEAVKEARRQINSWESAARAKAATNRNNL